VTFYVGILDGSGDVWGVRVPDCPGAYGAGATADAAVGHAVRGLAVWAESTLTDGDDLPVPSTLAEILASGEVEAGETTVLIRFCSARGEPSARM